MIRAVTLARRPGTVIAAWVVGAWVVAAWALALSVLLLWPQRLAGYGLGRDMVFTPRQPLDAQSLGVGSSAPRAVPVDALLALVEKVVDGAVVGRFALVLPLLLAGIGTARLLGRAGLPGRLAACGFAIWNPFVIERLALGQWSLLWGYAMLPWLVLAAVAYRRGRRPVAVLVVTVAAASITPTGGVLAVLLVVALLATSGRRGVAGIAVSVALQAPWVLAGALTSARTVSDPASVSAFASRDEFRGVVVTLLGLGGIWNGQVAPASRASALSLVAALVVAAALAVGFAVGFAAGFAAARERRVPIDGLIALTVLAVIGFVLAAMTDVPGGDAIVRTVVANVPGGGLLRDAQKWLAPLAVLAAVLIGLTVDRISAKMRIKVWIGVVACALPVALLPDATTVVWPTATPVHYPAGYAAADRALRASGRVGDVLVVPFQPYRAFAWADGRPSYDPAPRLLHPRHGAVITSDRLVVGDTTLAGEDPRAGEAATALRRPSANSLARAGFAYVLVETGTPGDVPSVSGLRLLSSADGARLYAVPGRVRTSPDPDIAAPVTVLTLWLLAVLLSAVIVLIPLGRRRRRQPADDLERESDAEAVALDRDRE